MFLDVVNGLMRERGVTKSELAKGSGIPYTTIDGWYKKGFDNVRLATLLRLARYFDVTVDFLVDDSAADKRPGLPELRLIGRYRELDKHGRRMVDFVLGEELERTKAEARQNSESSEDEAESATIPHFLTMAAAGFAAPQEGVDFELIPRTGKTPERAQFAVTIDGDSMEPYINNGEIVYCVKDSEGVRVGDVGVFCVDGAYYCKQYCTDGQNIYLLSLNRAREDADVAIWATGNQSITLMGRVLLDIKVPMP